MEILGYKDNSKLVFLKDNESLIFDFKDKGFYKVNPKSKTLRRVISAQAFFRNIEVEDVIRGFEDKIYANYIESINKGEKRCKNVATLLERVANYSHLEHYLQAGIKFSNPKTFTIPLQNFAKPVREFMATSRIDFTTHHKKEIWCRIGKYSWGENRYGYKEEITYNGWEKVYMANEELFINLCTYINTNYHRDLEVYRLWVEVGDAYSGNLNIFVELLTNYKLEYKTLFDYLIKVYRYEALTFNEACILLRDYLKMCKDLQRRSFDKYPKYLRTAHDLILRNYRNRSKTYDEIAFAEKVDKSLTWVKGEYQMVAPVTSNDIKKEATELDHCVASYIDRVLDGTTQILFLRYSIKKFKEMQATDLNEQIAKDLGLEKPEEVKDEEVKPEEVKDEEIEIPSLVTVEIRDGQIKQARGYKNRNVSEAEKDWLQIYAKEKQLIYNA